jgi:hypothetical protein
MNYILLVLIGGQARYQQALPPATAGQDVPVALPRLPAGTYGCQLIIGGVVQATQRVVIQ